MRSRICHPARRKKLPLPGPFGRSKALALGTWAGVFAFLLLTAWCILARPPHYVRSALGAAGLLLALIAAETALARKLPVNKLVRAGIGAALAAFVPVWLLRPFVVLTGAERNVREAAIAVCAAVWVVGAVLGAALVALGAWKAWRRDTQKR